ncbi:MAG: hypothetical protein JSU63_21625 [Phycisphaerales bacterium]|nr:MAG: hypothetical protein JSU63_21625 [Phycisphaerales bacterium]
MSRKVPPSLTALGRKSLPEEIDVNGQRYVLRRTFKNDFFAVTAMYEHKGEKVILKVGRQASFLLVPLGWIGRILARREQAIMQRLQGIEGIPQFIGRWGPTGIVREYIEGHPLAKGEQVSDDFFPRLRRQIDQIHTEGLAYVDLEKCENVLVGDDGRPYLFDFQISWYLPPWWGGELWPARKLRQWFQAGDRYHVVKLQRRTRPDQLTLEEVALSYRRPWYIRVQRFLAWPFTKVRRVVLNRIDPRRRSGERGRIAEE